MFASDADESDAFDRTVAARATWKLVSGEASVLLLFVSSGLLIWMWRELVALPELPNRGAEEKLILLDTTLFFVRLKGAGHLNESFF